MPSRNNRNNKNNINKSKFMSDDIQELKLIQINVDKTKKDVADISTYAQKEIIVIAKAIEKTLGKLDQLNKKAKGSYERLSKEERKLFQEQVKNARELNKEYDKRIEKSKELSNKEKEARNEYIKESNRMIDLEQSKVDAMRQVSNGNISGAFNTLQSGKKNYRDSQLVSQKEDLIKRFQSDPSFSRKDFDSQMGKITKSMQASSLKYEASTQAFSSAVKIIKGFADIWLKRFENGLNNIANTYENIYQKQAVLSGINEQQYQQAQKDMRDNIKQMGLEDNLAVTEVMNETSDYISKGITDFGKASQMGQTSAIGKVLAPYLDLQSEAMTSLELIMPGISKSMVGIGKFVSDSVGQNRFTQKNLQNLIELTEPVSLAAKKDLLGAEGLAMIEDLVAGGMDMQSATKMATDIAQAVANPLESLKNGPLQVKTAIAAGKRDFTGIADYAMGTQARLQAGTDGDLGTNAMLNEIGGWGVYNYNASGEFERVRSNLRSGKYTNSTIPSGKTYNEMLTNLANGQYTTALQEKDILAENLAVDLAIYKERWPDLYQVIRTVGLDIIKAIGLWIGTKLIGKLFNKGGSGLLKSLFGSGGKRAAASGGSKLLGNIAANGSWGAHSALGAAGTALAGTAGMAVGGYGIAKGIEDFQTGHTGRGIASTLSGGAAAAGGVMLTGGVVASAMGGVGLANAWNPVGWALMIGGAVGVVATAINRYNSKFEKNEENLAKWGQAVNERYAQMTNNIATEAKEQKSSLEKIRDNLEDNRDLETVRQQLIDTGILSEEDVSKSRDMNREGLIALTNQYLIEKNKLAGDAQEILDSFNKKESEGYADAMGTFMQRIKDDMSWNSVENHKGEWREITNQIYSSLNQKEYNGDELNDYQKKFLEVYKKKSKNGLNDNEIDDIYRDMGGKEHFDQLFSNNTETFYKINTSYGGNGNNNVMGSNRYTRYDENITTAIANLMALPDKESALEGLKNLRNNYDGVDYNSNTYGEQIKKVMNKYGIDSYAIGSNYISDNQLAYLHEGEAVLTKSAADVLRSSTLHNVSTVYGVSDAIQNGSVLNKEGFNLITSAINDQTIRLLAKMDQILAVVTNNKYTSKFNSKLVNLEGGVN